MDQSLNMVKIAYDALDDKLAEDIKIIDIRSISVLADYFIIADGNNKNQVQAMVDNVQEELFKAGYEMKQMEGYREGNWILLDFGDIIIHIFDKENHLDSFGYTLKSSSCILRRFSNRLDHTRNSIKYTSKPSADCANDSFDNISKYSKSCTCYCKRCSKY